MMKQPDVLLYERDAQALGGLDDRAVVLAAGGGGHVFDAGAGGAEDVVGEGELKFFGGRLDFDVKHNMYKRYIRKRDKSGELAVEWSRYIWMDVMNNNRYTYESVT